EICLISSASTAKPFPDPDDGCVFRRAVARSGLIAGPAAAARTSGTCIWIRIANPRARRYLRPVFLSKRGVIFFLVTQVSYPPARAVATTWRYNESPND